MEPAPMRVFPRFCLMGRWQEEMVGLILKDSEYLELRFEEFDLSKIWDLIKCRRV